MDCPSCATPMRKGVIDIRWPRFSFLVFGLSAPKGLIWEPDDDGDNELVLQQGEAASGHLCMSCGTLVVPPERA